MGEKERFEVLLEEVRHDVKTIAEGQQVFRAEVERRFQLVDRQFTDLRSDLKLYARQTEKHFSLLEARVK